MNVILYIYKKIKNEMGVEIVEEKKVTKISLSTFFLILAIIAICVMGYFLYVSNSKTADMISNEKELNAKIAKLENEIISKQDQIKTEQNNVNSSNNSNSNEISNTNNTTSNSSIVESNMTFSSLSGIYVGNAKVEQGKTPSGETEVKLYLYENGSFEYNDSPGLGSGKVGYYTFTENNIILHEVLLCANDIGRTITSDTMTLKISSDNSITDSKLNAILKKSSQKIENKTDVISTELKNALKNNSLQ